MISCPYPKPQLKKTLRVSGILSVSIFWRHSNLPLQFGPIVLSVRYTDQVISEDFLLSPVVSLLFPTPHGFLFPGLFHCLGKANFLLLHDKGVINSTFLRPCLSENIFIQPILSLSWIWFNPALEISVPTSEVLVLLSSTPKSRQWEVWSHRVAPLILNP